MYRRHAETAAAVADRMSQRHGAAVDIELRHVGLELFRPGQRYRREGLVDLEEVDVIHLQARLLEHFRRGGHRAGEHELGVGAHDSACHDASQRRQPQFLHLFPAHEQHRGRAVGHGTAETGGHPVGAGQHLEASSPSRVTPARIGSSASQRILLPSLSRPCTGMISFLK